MIIKHAPKKIAVKSEPAIEETYVEEEIVEEREYLWDDDAEEDI